MDFPCYNCYKMGDKILRCKDFIYCLKWCTWAKEHNIPIKEEDINGRKEKDY